jgi:putative solute:sodium symporter small subunit
MSDRDAKQAYWRNSRRLTSIAVAVVGALVLVLPLFMPTLNAHRFLRFPLGYFLAGTGSLVGVSILLYAFFSAQEKNDRTHNMTLQF